MTTFQACTNAGPFARGRSGLTINFSWMPRLEFNRTPFGVDFSINASNPSYHQYFAVWYLYDCDWGVYVFGKHFMRSVRR